MFNATEILIQAFVEELREGYHRTYGGYKPDYADIIAWAGSMALENIANSDALYHTVEHTIGVALVGQEILRVNIFVRGESLVRIGYILFCHWSVVILAM